ncbi:MAG TPA: hypothetical protein VMT88_00850 [Actinomycetes bacterium]|nr:hypothetical protein [Actinomycetes bacterium]
MRFKNLIIAAVVATLTAGTMLAAPASATNIGNEGCTPGYWKNHTSNWQEYTTASKLSNNFELGAFQAKWGTKTFQDALSFKGGTGLDGAFQILMRASTAAFLNAAHEGVGYPLRRFTDPGNMQDTINAALASGDRDTMISLAAYYDSLNNLGCPLN